jgi:dsRNA-specific ribonuclease
MAANGTSEPLRSEEFSRRKEEVAGWEAEITSYRIGEVYYCHVANVSPGATVARGEGPTRKEAEEDALAKARERFARTRRAGGG